jgi:ABC-2 type transport system ATP-binding protein
VTIIRTEGLSRHFGSLKAVEALSINVEKGEVFGLLGPNGAGKTTTLKMLTTLLAPTSGAAFVCGYDVVRQAVKVRRLSGYVPQLISADGTLTGYENLMVFARLYDVPGRECRDRVRAALEFMGLSDSADRLVRLYSGGMIRRLEIAQSVLHRPPVLFLDEPTVGLDPGARRLVWEHLDRLRREYSTTILMSTHQMEEAESLCSRVAILHHGRVAAIGTTSELKAAVGRRKNTTLDDVFIHFTGDLIDSGGNYRETTRTRRVAHRLG